MKFIVKNVFLVLGLMLNISVFATISIISIDHPLIGQNDGCVEIQATGDAGPFDIEFENGGLCDTQVNGTAECCGLSPGQYVMIVTDSNGCTETLEFTLEEQECDLDVTVIKQVDPTYTDLCSGLGSSNDGSISVNFGGVDLNNYSISWSSTFGENLNGTHTIDNLSSGLYTLNVQHKHIDDCNFFQFFVLNSCTTILPPECEETNSVSDLVSLDVTPSTTGCNGLIWTTLSNNSSNISFYWTFNGEVFDAPPVGLCPGEYCLHLDGNCAILEPECVTIEDCTNFIVTLSENCFKQNYSINDFIITGGTSPFEAPFEISNFSNSSTNLVRITDASGCQWSEIFKKDDFIDDFDFDLVIKAHFGNNSANSNFFNGAGSVNILSNLIYQTGVCSIEGIDADIVMHHGKIEVSVPYEYRDHQTFVFTYLDPGGCEYQGEFEIPVCNNQLGFPIVLERQTDLSDCTANQNHTYEVRLKDTSFPPASLENGPYFVKLQLINAAVPTEYYLVEKEYPRELYLVGAPLMFENVPAGDVRARSYNKCDTEFSTDYDENCCYAEFQCELLEVVLNEDGDKSHEYHFPFVKLFVQNSCWDEPNFGDPTGSLIYAEATWYNPEFENCFIGDIIITYTDGEIEIVTVDEDGQAELTLKRDDPFVPDSEGAYPVTIEYEGIDCTIEQTVEWYGDDHPSDIAYYFASSPVFDDYNSPWNGDHYVGGLNCTHCNYFNDDERIILADFDDELDCTTQELQVPGFGTFEWQPDDYSRPCSGGGTLKINFLDENWKGVIEYRHIEASVASSILIDELDYTPFNGNFEQICSVGGLCLFETTYPNMFPINFPTDKNLIATWTDPESCEAWNFISDNDNPQCGEPGLDECGTGMVCCNGVCIVSCSSDDDCQTGSECDDCGGCVPVEPPCDCQDNYACYQGNCISTNVCGFDENVSDGSDSATRYYDFYHQEGANATFNFTFVVFGIADAIKIYGNGLLYEESKDCFTNDLTTPLTVSIPSSAAGEGLITVEVESCANGSSYRINIDCIISLMENANVRSAMTKEFKVYPNPFNENFTIECDFSFESLDYFLYDVGGNSVKNGTILESDLRIFDIDASEIPSGIYYVQVTNEKGETFSQRIVKVKYYEE